LLELRSICAAHLSTDAEGSDRHSRGATYRDGDGSQTYFQFFFHDRVTTLSYVIHYVA
jgi:hypothetical protein